MLTGLANRRAMDEELQRRFAECQRTASSLSVMLLDVDHFKKFNDTHGHRAGDEALRVVARVLRGAMRQMDLVTRYGGEEFLVILAGTAIDGAGLVAERTRQNIGETTFRYDGKVLSLTVSIGIAQLSPSEHITRMLQRADDAMYASKQNGRNRTYWHDGRAVHPVVGESTANPPIQDIASLATVTPACQHLRADPSLSPSCIPTAPKTAAPSRQKPLDAGDSIAIELSSSGISASELRNGTGQATRSACWSFESSRSHTLWKLKLRRRSMPYCV